MALLTSEDVLNKKFTTVRFRDGYDQVEVDEFLDQVVATIYALQVQSKEASEKLEAAERRVKELSEGVPEEQAPTQAVVPQQSETPAEAKETPESATSMLALAQRVHDEYVRDGRAESDRIVADARKKSDEIVAEAQSKHRSILAQLDQERGLLESKINELRGFENEYRSAIRDHLQKLLSEVSTDVAPH